MWNSTIKKKLAKTQESPDSKLLLPKSVVAPADQTGMGSGVEGGTSGMLNTTGGDVSVSASSGENCFGKSGMEDFLQLIHNNCSGIDEEQDFSSMISGEELDCDYETGFF